MTTQQALCSRRPASPAALRAEVDLQDTLAMSLIVAMEKAADIAFHIVADEGWGVPSSYAESYVTLSHRGVIDGALADELSRLAALRNRIAHGYATLDVDRPWAKVPVGLDALERFAPAVARSIPPPTGRPRIGLVASSRPRSARSGARRLRVFLSRPSSEVRA